MNVSDEEIGHFSKDIIPKFKSLVAKRWKEGNPICMNDPMEYTIPYLVELLYSKIEQESKDN